MATRGSEQLKKAFRPSITGAELSRQLGVSRQAVSGWVNGDFLPSPDMMARIEDILGIPMRSWTEELPGEDREEGASDASDLTGTEHG